MKNVFVIILGFMVVLTGCMNQFKFRAKDMDGSAVVKTPKNEGAKVPDTGGVVPGNPKPEEPVIVDPDTEPGIYPVIYKRGDCTNDAYDVLPCFSCQIAMKPIGAPLSLKATQLAQIMELGCQVTNKSDPAGYFPPTRAEILKYLNRASQSLYPDSTPTSRQNSILNAWMIGDKTALSKLFGGLWYNPPYSDDFETYFGLEPKEARYLFCYRTPASSFSPFGTTAPLYSIGYSQCLHESGFSNSCREQTNYVHANVYRKQLVRAMAMSLNEPLNDQEMVPANKCHWQTMQGLYNVEMEHKVQEWKTKGYHMAVYYEANQPRCEAWSDQQSIALYSRVTIAGKQCVDF